MLSTKSKLYSLLVLGRDMTKELFLLVFIMFSTVKVSLPRDSKQDQQSFCFFTDISYQNIFDIFLHTCTRLFIALFSMIYTSLYRYRKNKKLFISGDDLSTENNEHKEYLSQATTCFSACFSCR